MEKIIGFTIKQQKVGDALFVDLKGKNNEPK